MKYFFTLVSVIFIVLASCEKKQPMQPGDDLFNELYDLRQIVLDSTDTKAGVVEPNWAKLSRNPIGKYRGYEGRTLLKFTSFSSIVDLPEEWIQSVELVVPVAYTSSDTTLAPSTTVTVHHYNADWDEDSETIDPTKFTSDTLSSVRFPGPVDSTAYDPMRFDLSPDLLQTWMDTSKINYGILLQGASEEFMLFAYERTIQNPPYLSVSVLDTAADTTNSYKFYPQEDYASLIGGDIPAGASDEIILQQAYGQRMAIKWHGLLDSLGGKNAYIHSAEILVTLDPSKSYSDFSSHTIVLAQEASAKADSFQASSSYSPYVESVSSSDTTLTVGTTSSNNFLRQYVQRIVTGDSVNTPLVIGYSSEGIGIKHLTVLPHRSKLRLVYSEVP